ncbi:MAG: DUF4190 domain-containing protein [Actinobacteria bacterium]|nr:DUF4190 domain-containing protein [Actinomycetota bacterium]
MNEVEKTNDFRLMGILSMVFGIIAIVLSCVTMGKFLVILLGIAAIVLGIIDLDKISREKDSGNKGMAISGIVLGSLAIVFSMVAGLIGGLFFIKWLKGGSCPMIQRFFDMGRFRNFK